MCLSSTPTPPYQHTHTYTTHTIWACKRIAMGGGAELILLCIIHVMGMAAWVERARMRHRHRD